MLISNDQGIKMYQDYKWKEIFNNFYTCTTKY